MKSLFKWLAGKIKSDQTEVIIFFAGHGLASINGNSPDNIVLTDNHFWAVIHDYKLTDYSSCGSNVNCSLPWSVLKLNRDNLNLIERIPFESVNMGIGTVALKVDDTLWFGSFRSNRLGLTEY